MSCDISKGFLESCKSSVGGINNIYLLNFADVPTSGIVYDSTDTDAISTLGTGLTAYKYELKATTNTLEQTVNSSRDAGTTFFQIALNIVLKKMTKEANKELKLLAYGRPKILVETNNGDLLLCGYEHGMDVISGTFSTGGSLADASGYSLGLEGNEKLPANFCIDPTGASGTIGALLTALGISTVVTT